MISDAFYTVNTYDASNASHLHDLQNCSDVYRHAYSTALTTISAVVRRYEASAATVVSSMIAHKSLKEQPNPSDSHCDKLLPPGMPILPNPQEADAEVFA